ncbi:amino acid permease [Carbonactinospora thermoautotrophica]|uniref:amino acid permease n=1 Tax=Carbonactinospora thermoautotrophica TaxID=1469144 RepID=UPI002270FFE5|nr:amino acid permease [Carbonactinospora thermoautotrophica]MCX9190710.1 amino acid permease [Carbonactinospora thermoautotrophica]
MSLLRTKSVEQSIRDTEEPEHRLRKDLTALDLTVFGIGVIIGTGIFVLTGVAAKDYAGPAVALSFVVAGVVCALAALCYAEFASTVPVAGSAYTFSYATLGELPAWIIGWDLVLELALGAAVVSVGWSNYLTNLLENFGISLPGVIADSADGVFNLPAAMIALLLTAVLTIGIKISSRVNLVIVTLKVAVVLFVIFAGLFFVKGENYRPFIPDPVSGKAVEGLRAPLVQVLFGIAPVSFGVFGIFTAAAVVFFAYIGFDVVATAAEETRRPQRDLPIGIIGSLAICTALYVAVSLVVTGMQHYTKLDEHAPLAAAFAAVGHPGFAVIIALGGLAGLTTVVMILMLGQARVLFAMSRDHLLPPAFAKVHPRFGTPYRIQITVGVMTAVLAGFIPLAALAEMVNIGTLCAFVLVSIAVIILRRTRPDLRRAFRTPLVPLVPAFSALAAFYLMLNLAVETWLRFLVWMVIGFFIYFLYSRSHSKLARLVGDEVAGEREVLAETTSPSDRDGKQ